MRQQHITSTMFGKWSMAVSLMSDTKSALPAMRREMMLGRLRSGLEDMAKSETPDLDSWRDLSDAMNWLQSCLELGWIEDPGQTIGHAKMALMDGHSHAIKGKLRVSGPSLQALRAMVEQFGEVLAAVSERSYWVAVREAEKRISKIWRGQRKPGDVVVSL